MGSKLCAIAWLSRARLRLRNERAALPERPHGGRSSAPHGPAMKASSKKITPIHPPIISAEVPHAPRPRALPERLAFPRPSGGIVVATSHPSSRPTTPP